MSAPNFFTGFLALGTGSTSFVELTGSGYGRQAITLGPIVGGTVVSVTAFTFAATGAWPTATQQALYDAAGNLILWWSRASPFTLASGSTHAEAPGAATITFPDLIIPPFAASVLFAPSCVVGTLGSVAQVTSGVSLQFAVGQVGAL